MKRVVIETSDSTKKVLEKVLDDQGKTLTDWFNDKVEEEAPAIYDTINPTPQDELVNIEELQDSKRVLAKIQEQDWSFTNNITSYLSHNLHPYPAKYIPQIPRRLIQLLSIKGEKIWDPFGGSGTTALEALLLGRQAVSSDINPIAKYIGLAKTTSLTENQEEQLKRLIEDFKILISDQNNLSNALIRYGDKIKEYTPDIVNSEKWFSKIVSNELAFIRFKVMETLCKEAQTVAIAIFSKIIIKSSYQDGETRYVSKPRETTSGTTIKLYISELLSTLSKIRQLPAALKFRKAQFITADLTNFTDVDPDSIDLIVTSPPYPNATDYHLYHRFRIFWLGFDPKDMAKKEIGSHLRHQKEATEIDQYLREMKLCLDRMFISLRSSRYAVLVLGDAMFNGQHFKTAELLQEQAISAGFEVVGITSRDLHETKRSFVSAARRLREEKFLILKKPVQNINFELYMPNYKLWPYEDYIRKCEIESIFKNKIIDVDASYRHVTLNPLHARDLKKLTFTHSFQASNFAKEQSWQSILENGDYQDQKSNRKDPKYVTHGIHAYKGKFYPQLAKSLFNLANLTPNSKVLDPFSGSGTVLLEGYLNGLECHGLDLNPLAIKIAKAKTKIITLDPQVVDHVLTQFINDVEEINDADENREIFDNEVIDELVSWFPIPVLNKLGWLLKHISDVPEPHIGEFLEVCLSSIVREISQQEPKDLRIRRRGTPIVDAPVKELFLKKLIEQKQKLLKFSEITKYSPFEFNNVSINQADCRSLDSYKNSNIKKGSIDAVVTSPPYASALPYIDTDRLSILLLFSMKSKTRADLEKSLIGAREITKKERDSTDKLIFGDEFEPISSKTAVETIKSVYLQNSISDAGFRRKNNAALLYRYYNDMASVLKNLDYVVRSDGDIFFVIGDNKTEINGNEILIKSGKVLQEMGCELGWKLNEVIPITVTQENRFHNKNGITENDIIWFKK